MAHKKQHSGPIPPGNQSRMGPGAPPGRQADENAKAPDEGAPFEDQDEKRRLGNFEGKGEHSFQQPGGNNDANR